MTASIPLDLQVRGPAGPAPDRVPGSVRRTSTIDMHWPAGWGTQLRLEGRARDLLTPADGSPALVLAEDVMRAGVSGDRTIEEIESIPPRPALQDLVGSRGGGNSRGRVAEVLPDERSAATPLYLLLDDIAGATLIAGFAYSQWMSADQKLSLGRLAPKRRMEGICTGFTSGSSALDADGSARLTHQVKTVPPIQSETDPLGWHSLPEAAEISMRRARRIDVRLRGGVIEIDSMFQDSCTEPSGGRMAVHEYRLEATADPVSGELLTLRAEPRVLPYNECPLAAGNIGTLLGTPLAELRTVVLEQFKGTRGCTHLNDALRALAEVPVLVQPLLSR